MRISNSRFLSRTTLAVLACTGLAFGCVDNGRDSGVRDDAATTAPTDTSSGATTSMSDTTATSATDTTGDTTSGATAPASDDTTSGASSAAPAAGTTGTTSAPATTTGAAGTAGAGTSAATAPAATTEETPATGKMTAKKKANKKMDKKSDRPAEGAKTDSSSNSDLGATGSIGAYDASDDENLRDEAGTEIGDTTAASSPNAEEDLTMDESMSEDETVSGATSAPADSSASSPTASGASTGTESVSTTSASDEDLKESSKMAAAISPWYTEPYSRIPTHVGSTTLTGKDKSVAALERYSVFIDPPALERTLVGRDAVRPVSEIDFNSFDYDKRSRFSSQMNARLVNIDSRLDMIESRSPDMKSDIESIHSDHLALENQLEDIREVDETNWTSFRDSFRDRLTALEREVARLSVSARE